MLMRFTPYSSNINFQAKKKIEYNDATTVSMAKMLGKKQLGVREYRDFGSDSLEVLNFINRGLVAAKNASRNNIRTPNYIDFSPLETARMSVKYNGGILTVNKNIFSFDGLTNEITRMSKEMLKDGVLLGKNNGYFLNEDLSNTKAEEFLEHIKSEFCSDLSKLSYEERLDLYFQLRVFYEQTSNLNRFPKDLIIKMFEAGCWGEFDEVDVEIFKEEIFSVPKEENFKTLFEFLKQSGRVEINFNFDTSKYRIIFHETGHLQDLELYNQFDVDEFSSWDKYPKELKQWLNDKEDLKAAFEVSPYACFGKGEFFAECYSWLLSGKQLPPKAQELYKKIKAPKVVLR